MRSNRLGKLPPYLFDEIDRLKEAYTGSGTEILDLGIGDPDIFPPDKLIRALINSLDNPRYHRYPSGDGLPRLKLAIREWLKKRYDIEFKNEEILVTIGSKEAIGHLPLAVVDPGDTVLIPDPGYPVYNSSAVLAGADAHTMPLTEELGYWPAFEEIGDKVSRKSKLMFLNYPNNPTSAVADRDKFAGAVEYCRRNNIVLANDAAYSEISFNHPVDLLFPVARETDVSYLEFFSFSKSLSIAGWRIGFVIGSEDIISYLSKIKANIDSGAFSAVQDAVAVMLNGDFEKVTRNIMSVYRERRAILSSGLDRAGFDYIFPQATFYFWIKTPGDFNSIRFCKYLLKKTGIVCTPGVGFGKYGEGHIRLSLTADTEIIKKAAEKLAVFS
ncbi:MAG: aminotransferase class I/II-fold pyridoxal phosphate-dependent enzyme [Candidatus Krumholzibacteriota bacterium]|nr:aminotransferase class I/II-fold pyridoxal phosphate-dependent enzyme [Candidatus Krumholzibacteriota bacterium]